MTALVIINKDMRDGRRGRLAHKLYVPPIPPPSHPHPPHVTITHLDYCIKTKDCRKDERLRSFDTKISCNADVSSLPSINNVVIRRPRKLHSSIQSLIIRLKKN